MDSTTDVKKHTHRIKGPAGFLYVEENGTGDGLVVVFTHSFGGSADHWKHQIEHLQDNRGVITFDFRNHGRSDKDSKNEHTAEALAEDIAAVVDSLQVERFVLVGHSMGGAAAIAYTDKHPEKVAGVVLAGTPGKSSPEQSKPIIASLESDAYSKVMDQYMKQLLESAKPEVDSMVMEEFRKLARETSLSVIKSLFQYDPLPALKRYKGPVVIVSTAREKEQPNSLPNQLAVPNHVINGTSHWTQLDKPNEFNRILDDFLKKVK